MIAEKTCGVGDGAFSAGTVEPSSVNSIRATPLSAAAKTTTLKVWLTLIGVFVNGDAI